jgi:hypothetical protein
VSRHQVLDSHDRPGRRPRGAHSRDKADAHQDEDRHSARHVHPQNANLLRVGVGRRREPEKPRTRQSVTPFQCGMGVARKLNLWPTTGWKSLFISHSSISGPCVRARQIFSAGCGISRSTTIERVAAGSVIGPQEVFEAIEPVTPEGAVKAHPVDQRRQTLRLGAVVGLAPLAPVTHQSGESSGRRHTRLSTVVGLPCLTKGQVSR